MQTIIKDITTVTRGVIIHQVNNMGVMGAGVALAIKNKYPKHYRDYIHHCSGKSPESLLGDVIFTQVTSELFIAGIFSQNNYNTSHSKDTSGVFTDYTAMSQALGQVQKSDRLKGLQRYLPFKIGSVLGGGDWDIVQVVVESAIPDAIYCKLTN